ncbi:TcpE family protein [Seinonella peptonophila]|uniref:TcpE family protein n=1 Tax=Seinonella peptonophila TaxID=112248 RepID=A0A1M4WLS7_9BACL|nr:conjugal transfer protein [Seinonella peptonophila]SHE82154.1 TcpE family protein [Seinonella peptonophila]
MKQIRIYNRVFRIEKTVYSIQGIHLPLPVSYRQMAFFVVSLLIMICLNLLPPLSWIDFYLVKFIGVPFLVTWFFTRKTLDGKAPHRFLYRYFEHLFSNHHYARYQKIERPKEKYFQYDGEVVYRLNSGGDS